MTESLIDSPFHERLADGQEFEDFVIQQLYRHGLPFVSFGSRKFQWRHGEAMAHIEVKHDRLFNKTGNLFIETKERRNDSGSQWRLAGIYDASNPWIYVIGDESKLFILGVRILKLLHHCSRGYKIKETNTSHGFLLPVQDAEKYAVQTLDLMPQRLLRPGLTT